MLAQNTGNMGRRLRRSTLWGLSVMFSVAAIPGSGAEPFDHVNVRIETNRWTGQRGSLICSAINLDEETFYTAVAWLHHDGKQGGIRTVGHVYEEYFAFNDDVAIRLTDRLESGQQIPRSEYAVQFDSIGTSIEFRFSEYGGTQNDPPTGFDAFSAYLLGEDGVSLVPTADPLGTNALFSFSPITIYDYELSVFAPMKFVIPDSLVLSDSAVVAVEEPERSTDRLRIIAAGPNPFERDFQMSFEVPAPGGQMEASIYDIGGRLVRRLLNGRFSEGMTSVSWGGIDESGRRVGSGVYFLRIEMSGQSVIRKIVAL